MGLEDEEREKEKEMGGDPQSSLAFSQYSWGDTLYLQSTSLQVCYAELKAEAAPGPAQCKQASGIPQALPQMLYNCTAKASRAQILACHLCY